MASLNPCAVLTTLTDLQAQVMTELYAKFRSLQRLAEILEKAGDVSGFFSNLLALLPNLVPVDLLRGVEAYNSIRDACPMLGLPEANTGKLQTDLARAYADLIRRIDLHQFNRLDKLQERLDDLVSKANAAMSTDWMRCASAVCAAADKVSVASLKDNFRQELARVANLPADAAEAAKKPFRVLNDSAVKKVSDLKEARVKIIQLGQSENASIQTMFNRLSRTAKVKA
jgi:hypothetical protein